MLLGLRDGADGRRGRPGRLLQRSGRHRDGTLTAGAAGRLQADRARARPRAGGPPSRAPPDRHRLADARRPRARTAGPGAAPSGRDGPPLRAGSAARARSRARPAGRLAPGRGACGARRRTARRQGRQAAKGIMRPVLLTIDVGNTQTHVGAFDGEELVEHWRFSTDRQSTGDELAIVIHALLALRGIAFDQIHGEAISSVVPRLASEYRYMFERYLDREALILGPGTKTGMPILLENPHELGPDRLANAVAGYDRCRSACVVVDFGTAINYDVVSGAGE